MGNLREAGERGGGPPKGWGRGDLVQCPLQSGIIYFFPRNFFVHQMVHFSGSMLLSIISRNFKLMLDLANWKLIRL